MGLLRPTHLLYGVANAAAVFQATMDKVLHGLAGVICYQDDILVSGTSEPDHWKNLQAVLTRLNDFGVKLNRAKCMFRQTEIEYLGHRIDEYGIHPTNAKIADIMNIESPTDLTKLQAFLGILNYYKKFIKGSTELLLPLYALLKKDQPWLWTMDCEQAFQKCKTVLTSKSILIHYNESLPIRLECDASPFGVGSVLSHIMPDGSDRPIAFASRTLTKSEGNYAHIEKEALAIVFGLKKFEQYLFGKRFEILTDHKPLLGIFSPTSATPVLAAARLQRWAVLLAMHSYTIKYRKGSEHLNADTLSRLPSKEIFDFEGKIFKLSFLEDIPIDSKDIASATCTDHVLGRVINAVKYGWHFPIPADLQPYFSRRDSLSIDGECLVWGMHVIAPEKYKRHILDVLHDTHPGIVRMKQIARSHVWWPKIDSDIENLSRTCHSCVQQQKLPPTSPMQSWIWPKAPWHRVHIDFAQKGKDFFLVLVDSHSKWVEVKRMNSITSLATIQKLRELVSSYGIPLEVVSDNGPQFTSSEFENFLRQNGIKHTLVPIYHPKSNGSAERCVQHFKAALQKMCDDVLDATTLDHKIARFLLMQHSTPQATTGVAPSTLFLGRTLQTRLSFIHSNIENVVHENQSVQKRYHDRQHTTFRNFEVGSRVLYKNYSADKINWSVGTIVSQESSKTWKVSDGNNVKSFHTDQLRPSYEANIEAPTQDSEAHCMLDDIISSGGNELKDKELYKQLSLDIKNAPILEVDAKVTENITNPNDNVKEE